MFMCCDGKTIRRTLCCASIKMIVSKIALVFFLAVSVGAEKKIELQDIEEDNLKSEKETVTHKSDEESQISGSDPGRGLVPLELLKSNLLRYFAHQPSAPQQRYVHQYAVTEPPERSSTAATLQYSPPTAPQHAMVGYLSNIPMQVYLIPQYYTDHVLNPQQQINHQPPNANPHLHTTAVTRVAAYHTAPEAVHAQSNYIEVPYMTTGKTFVQQYTPSVYVGYPAQPTVAPTQATGAPIVTYQVPVIEYNPTVVPTTAPKVYYNNHQYTENNSVDDVQEHGDDQRQYSVQTEVPFHKPMAEFPRHYNSRVPIREDYRPLHSHGITELPHPNPLLLRASPPHLAHIPKTLPVYRPVAKSVYQGHVSTTFNPRPHDIYGPPFKRRPTSLIDSYIPSSVQVEYLKRGLIKEPAAVYDALASGRLPHPIPRHYDRGFLPNQMYHTGAGAVTYGHYKRASKVQEKIQ